MNRLTRTVAVVLLIAATFLVYWPALRNGFVWDDTALVLRDPLIRSPSLIPEGFRHFLFLDATASDFYRPLQRLTFTADYALYGFGAPWGWHLTSVALHAAAAVALFFLLGKLARSQARRPVPDGVAFGVALLWAVHPLHTSAVTYVAGRADPLAALCGFGALALALTSLETGRWSKWTALGAAVGFLAALLSKESGIVALLIWFLLLAWRRTPWRVVGRWVGIAAVVLGFYCALRLTAERTAPPPAPTTPLVTRPLLAARALAEYAGLIIAPVNLRMERDVSTFPQATLEATQRHARLREYQTLLGIVLALGFGAWFWRARRAVPLAAFALAASLVAYLPISNLFSLNATVAEHWLYVPSAFLFLAALLSLRHFVAPRWHGLGLAFAAGWMIFLGVRTTQQQRVWHDPRTFLNWTLQHGGDTARMHINLGNLESAAGKHAAALAEFRTAIARSPEQPLAWFGLANAAIRARDFATAHEALDRMPPSPLLAGGLLQTRAVLEHLETGRDTGDLLRQAVEGAPKAWEARKRYLEYLDERGQTAQAARELRDFLQGQSFRADSWRLLGTFLEKLAQPAAARAAYEQAAERDVRDEVSRTRLAAIPAG